MHAEVPLAKVPTGQVEAVNEQEAAPSVLNAPWSQGMQVVGDVALAIEEKVPAEQGVHKVGAVALPHFPAGHVIVVQTEAPWKLADPAAHGAQSALEVAPLREEKVPGGHAVGAAEASGQKKPDGQTVCVAGHEPALI